VVQVSLERGRIAASSLTFLSVSLIRNSRSFGSHADVCQPSACRAQRRWVRSTSAKSSAVHSANGLSSRALFAIQIGGAVGDRLRLDRHAGAAIVLAFE